MCVEWLSRVDLSGKYKMSSDNAATIEALSKRNKQQKFLVCTIFTTN